MEMNTVLDLIQKFGLPLVMLALVLYAFKNYLDKFIAASDKDKEEFRQMVADKDRKIDIHHEWAKTTFMDVISDCKLALQGVANIVERRDPNAPRIPITTNNQRP